MNSDTHFLLELQEEDKTIAKLSERLERLSDGAGGEDPAETEERDAGSEREAVARQLTEAHKRREGVRKRVPGQLLMMYDRIFARHANGALHPLRGASCGNCDTVVPVQRRNTMASSGRIELCEGCGVLLYSG